MADLSALVARIGKLTRSDRDLDYEIAAALGWERKVGSVTEDDYWRKGDWSWTREDSEHPPRYTEILAQVMPLIKVAPHG
jgi:hypothetical protein